jgi:hypothetical protein
MMLNVPEIIGKANSDLSVLMTCQLNFVNCQALAN